MSLALFPEAEAPEQERELRAIIARDDATHFLVERDDGTGAGFVEVGTRPYVDGCDSSPVGFIEAWYVDPDVRRAGYGRALLAAAEDWARTRGLQEMGSDALLENTVSHRAHEAAGYQEVERAVRFRKSLAVTPVSDVVRAEIVRRLGIERGRQAIAGIAAVRLPLIDAGKLRDRHRIQIALLKLIERDFARMDYHLKVAASDWRDTLVGAGFGNVNWPDVMRAEGYPVD